MCLWGSGLRAQSPELGMNVTRQLPATSVKNQGVTGTCWCFSTTALLESEALRAGLPEPDLSEMFTVRNVYLEKADNYIRRQGRAQFDEGGLGHDMLAATARYGAMPETAYSGLKAGSRGHHHAKLIKDLRNYLDEVLQKKPISEDWKAGFTKILDEALGTPPAEFTYNGKTYTPQAFAKDVLHFNADEYVLLTSYTHHPFYESFVLEVPDNWANAAYFNVPLSELTGAAKTALSQGHTLMWDADVSHPGWNQRKGYALEAADGERAGDNPDIHEKTVTQGSRQALFDSQVTTDDHLMQITGTATSPGGKPFFMVKNSWGAETGPFKGYMYVSEAYFANNTVSLVLPRAALSPQLLERLRR